MRLCLGDPCWLEGQKRRDGENAEKRKGWKVLPFQPILPLLLILPRVSDYLLNVPKNAERLFGSLHFVPSIEPLKLC